MNSRQEGKTLLITGAAGALGSALSELSLRRGFNTVMLDRDRRGLEALYDRLTADSLPEPVIHPLDLATAGTADFEQLLSAIESEFGGLDGLIHCAARFEGLTPLEHVPPPEWLASVQVNLNAAWLLSALSLPLLRASAAGRLYFLLDDPERVAAPLWGPYGVCKHALHALAGQFARECEATAIQVHGIDPGPMRSNLRSRAYLAEDPASLPTPESVAARIIEMIAGAERPAGTIVRLARRG